jgi:mono/diheme cytochrome c family protein/glucose/arabinose dehydrogenase
MAKTWIPALMVCLGSGAAGGYATLQSASRSPAQAVRKIGQAPALKSISNRPWPPGVQSVSDESPVLSPAAAMKTFFMPPGYRLELVTSEPMVQDPIAIDFDPDGRMWVIELTGYMRTIVAEREHDPLCRIVVLEDVDDDGRMDKRTVFADGLVLPRAVKVLDRGVLVAEPPNLWLMRDKDGDFRVDAKALITDRFGRRDANVEHNANSLTWALDNWIYTSETDVYLRARHGQFEVRTTLARGQWGNSQDDVGRIFRNTNESVLHVDLVPTPYFERNPNLVRTRGSYESLEGEKNEVNTVWPVRPTRGVNRGYQSGILRPDGTLAAHTSVGSPVVYRGDRLPSDLYGNVFVTEPAGNLVSRIVLSEENGTVRARKAYDGAEFLASTDERFRPVNLSNAPDGTLYVVDMYRGVIQHRGYITEYLRNHIVSHTLEQPIGYGRIYRVMHETTRRDRKPAMSKASARSLVDMLSLPNGWRRDTAQRLLVERGDSSVVSALEKLAQAAPAPRTRLHALWTLDGLDAIDRATVLHALEDRSAHVRASAVRLSERWLSSDDQPIRSAVLGREADVDAGVRRQLAASLGVLPESSRDTAVASVLVQCGNDPVVVDAALSGVAGRESAVLDRIVAERANADSAPAVTMLAATIVRGRQEAAVQALFERIADSARPEWQRAAMLAGAEVTLAGAAAPGANGRAGRGRAVAGAPCPTCPGARSGPGGAPAFPAVGRARGAEPTGEGSDAATPVVRPGGRGASTPPLELSREPTLARITSDGVLGGRATSLLARIVWPGKPGVQATTVAPLTPAEQARFDAGQKMYQSLCEACHQPDGRGAEKLAATLVGSELALAKPDISVRILLNGKEGPVGLMPAVGDGLTDDQIASVLTYIRRAWGNPGSPVDPAAIKEARALTADRTRPWTHDELMKLLNEAK